MIPLDKAINHVISLKLDAVDKYFAEVIDPIMREIKNPEKVIGKKYEEWKPEDLQRLILAYQTMPNLLTDFIAKKEYDSLIKMRQEAVI